MRKDLWDDSALINAFDDAIRKYKTMNLTQVNGSSAEGGSAISGRREDVSGIAAESNMPLRSSAVAATGQLDTSNAVEETREANYVPRGESQQENSDALEYEEQAANDHIMPEEEAYNALLARYYKLEEERHQVLQQLHYSYYGQDYHNGGVAWVPPSQQYPVPNVHGYNPWPYAQAYYPTGAYPCPWMAPCSVVPAHRARDISRTVCNAPVSDEAVSDKSCHIGDNDTVNIAMEAAKKAEVITRTETCLGSSGNKVTGKEDRSIAQTSSQETDLLAVLNAWYSAGLYTGKYLGEHSITKK